MAKGGSSQGDAKSFKIQRRESDIWNDLVVLYYIKYREYPPNISESEKSRIRKRARGYVFVDLDLFKIGPRGSQRRVIPPYDERLSIVQEVHERMHHRKEKPMLNYLRSVYFWDHMADDVRTVCQSCPICQQMKAKHFVDEY